MYIVLWTRGTSSLTGAWRKEACKAKNHVKACSKSKPPDSLAWVANIRVESP